MWTNGRDIATYTFTKSTVVAFWQHYPSSGSIFVLLFGGMVVPLNPASFSETGAPMLSVVGVAFLKKLFQSQFWGNGSLQAFQALQMLLHFPLERVTKKHPLNASSSSARGSRSLFKSLSTCFLRSHIIRMCRCIAQNDESCASWPLYQSSMLVCLSGLPSKSAPTELLRLRPSL